MRVSGFYTRLIKKLLGTNFKDSTFFESLVYYQTNKFTRKKLNDIAIDPKISLWLKN